MKPGQIKASALPYTILIMMLILIICSMLVGVQYLNGRIYENEKKLIKLNDNIFSASNMIMAETELFKTTDSLDLTIGNTSDSVHIIRQQWGFFEVFNIKARLGRKEIEKMLLTGMEYNNHKAPALYLANHNKFLYNVGKVKIKGDSYIPGGIVKTGYLNGIGYGSDLITTGKMFESNSDLPELDKNMIQGVANYLNYQECADSVINVSSNELLIIDKQQSFRKGALVFNSDNELVVGNCKIKGKIIIRSSKQIIIEPTAELTDIIIMAPYVKVSKGFNGTLQIFGRDSVIVEDGCVLNYPSIIGAFGQESKIHLQKNSFLAGGLILTGKETTNSASNVIQIDKDVTTIGVIYSASNTDISGSTTGTLYSNNLIFHYKYLKYNNYLYDAKLNSVDVPDFYVAPLFLSNQYKRKQIEWLD